MCIRISQKIWWKFGFRWRKSLPTIPRPSSPQHVMQQVYLLYFCSMHFERITTCSAYGIKDVYALNPPQHIGFFSQSSAQSFSLLPCAAGILRAIGPSAPGECSRHCSVCVVTFDALAVDFPMRGAAAVVCKLRLQRAPARRDRSRGGALTQLTAEGSAVEWRCRCASLGAGVPGSRQSAGGVGCGASAAGSDGARTACRTLAWIREGSTMGPRAVSI
jgi:hypothetical protein